MCINAYPVAPHTRHLHSHTRRKKLAPAHAACPSSDDGDPDITVDVDGDDVLAAAWANLSQEHSHWDAEQLGAVGDFFVRLRHAEGWSSPDAIASEAVLATEVKRGLPRDFPRRCQLPQSAPFSSSRVGGVDKAWLLASEWCARV